MAIGWDSEKEPLFFLYISHELREHLFKYGGLQQVQDYSKQVKPQVIWIAIFVLVPAADKKRKSSFRKLDKKTSKKKCRFGWRLYRKLFIGKSRVRWLSSDDSLAQSCPNLRDEFIANDCLESPFEVEEIVILVIAHGRLWTCCCSSLVSNIGMSLQS